MRPKIEYFGKFILLKPIGEGGMGSVYLARTKGRDGINKNVAIKMMHPDFAKDPKGLDMFRHEAALAIKFNHGNIVGVHEFGMINNQCYVAMDYVPGENLRYLIENLPYTEERLESEEVLFIARSIAGGLDYLHRFKDPRTGEPLSIIHRDINPHNVMINFEGEIKIIDFGVAKTTLVADKSFAQQAAGKVRYMSPEQINGELVDQSTDIFSLGLVIWEMIAGQQIYKGLKRPEVMENISNFQLPTLPEPREDLPYELIEILHKATARSPEDRYPTVNLMLREISMALNKLYPDYTADDFRERVSQFFADEIVMESDFQKKLAAVGQPVTQDSAIWQENHLEAKDRRQTQTRSLQTAPLKDRALESLSWFLKVDTLKAVAIATLLYFVMSQAGHYLSKAYQKNQSKIQSTFETIRLNPRYRNITVKSSPTAARIYLNDKLLDAITPVQIRIYENRRNIIGLEKDGYVTEYVSIARDVSSITIRLNPDSDHQLSKRLEAILSAREKRIEQQKQKIKQNEIKAVEQQEPEEQDLASEGSPSNEASSTKESLPKISISQPNQKPKAPASVDEALEDSANDPTDSSAVENPYTPE